MADIKNQQSQVLLNLTHHSILFVDNAYQESQTIKWRDWIPLVYSQKGTLQSYYQIYNTHQRELHTQIELNRLRYSCFGDVAKLKPENRTTGFYSHLGNTSH